MSSLNTISDGIASGTHDAAKRGDEFWGGAAQFLVVMQRQLAEDLFALGSQRQQNFPAIVLCAGAMNEAARFQPIN
jgi:hypothetical protein